MARSISEIKKIMTDAFLSNGTLREAYGIEDNKKQWRDCFSAVAIENLLFFIVASCHYVLECLVERFVADVDKKIARSIVASVPWYYQKSLEFQYGDALILNPNTYAYGYNKIDEAKRLVKYVAVRDRGSSIEILVSGQTNNKPSILSDDVLTAFKRYINAIKIAGVVVNVYSRDADQISVEVQVQIDPLVLDVSGATITNGNKPVEKAIEAYLANITYGGTFNKTKFIDAIQSVTGVVDVSLKRCFIMPSGSNVWREVEGNNYTSVGGSFVANQLNSGIDYVV